MEIIIALGVVGSGIAIALVTEVAKKWKSIPLAPTNKTGIRLIVGVLALVVGVLQTVEEGKQVLDMQLLETLGLSTVSTYAISWLTYKGLIK